MRDLLVGVDIGGTKTAALLVTHDGQVLSETALPTFSKSPEQVVYSVRRAVATVLDEAGGTVRDVAAVGAGVPGLVERDAGVVRMAANLNLEQYPLGAALSAEFNAPVLIENDVRAASVGIYQHLNVTEPLNHLAYLSVGTGISAGVILNGQLHRGSNGMAGEIGHVVVDPGGIQCSCGQRGCVETIVAGPAIARQAARYFDQPLTAADVYKAAAHGNADAVEIVRHVSVLLGRTIQWLVMAYDVEKVVVGGGVANSGDAFLQPILTHVAHLRTHSPLTQMMLPDSKIMLLPTGFNAGTWGALHLARQAAQLHFQGSA